MSHGRPRAYRSIGGDQTDRRHPGHARAQTIFNALRAEGREVLVLTFDTGHEVTVVVDGRRFTDNTMLGAAQAADAVYGGVPYNEGARQ